MKGTANDQLLLNTIHQRDSFLLFREYELNPINAGNSF